MENKIQLSKKDRMSVALRHQFLQLRAYAERWLGILNDSSHQKALSKQRRSGSSS